MDLQDQVDLDGRHDQAVEGHIPPCDAAADRGCELDGLEVDHDHASHAEGHDQAEEDLREDRGREGTHGRGVGRSCSRDEGDGPRTVLTCCWNATDHSHRCPKRREAHSHHPRYRWEAAEESAADTRRTRSLDGLDGQEGEGRGRSLLREDLVVDRRDCGRRDGHCQRGAGDTEGRWWRAAEGRGVPAGGAPIATLEPMPMPMLARMILRRCCWGQGHRWTTRWVRPTWWKFN